MAEPRRIGAEGSKMRARFVDAAEAILREEGGHAVSARVVAEKAGLKAQLLFYYFRTMDDLLRAVIKRINERRLERFEQALAAPEPLRALWDLNTDASSAILAIELNALANRREAIRAEIVDGARQFRVIQTEATRRLLPSTEQEAAAGIVMIAASLARMLANETALGLTEGHADAIAIVDNSLRVWGVPGGRKRPPRGNAPAIAGDAVTKC
jgi:AcrR family transcriptional regulator